MKNDFSKKLSYALNYRDMKAITLSKKTGISSGMISDYIHGRVNPKQDKVYLIAKALKINPTWLLGYPDAEMIPEKEKSEEKEVHTITSKDIFSADGKRVTGQEILDLINERIRQNRNKKK